MSPHSEVGQPPKALLLDGGGLGGGVSAKSGGKAQDGAGADQRYSRTTTATPPSPTLPPSRGKGAFEHPAHASGAVKRARSLRQRMPAGETKLWDVLRKLKLGIRRQAPIGPYIVDFAHHGASLVVEVDGPVHDEPEVQLRDLDRDAWLKSQGYRVLRFTSRDAFEDPYGIAQQVEVLISAKRGFAPATVATPPSPTLPPSRGKGG